MKNKSKLLLSLMFISSVFGTCDSCSFGHFCWVETGDAYHKCMRDYCDDC